MQNTFPKFSFSRGEITPRLYGRFDLPFYHNGVEECLNWIVLTHGGIVRRIGTRAMASIHPEYIKNKNNDQVHHRIFPFKATYLEYVLLLRENMTIYKDIPDEYGHSIMVKEGSKRGQEKENYPTINEVSKDSLEVGCIYRAEISTKGDYPIVWIVIEVDEELVKKDLSFTFRTYEKGVGGQVFDNFKDIKSSGWHCFKIVVIKDIHHMMEILSTKDAAKFISIKILDKEEGMVVAHPYTYGDLETLSYAHIGTKLYLVGYDLPPYEFEFKSHTGHMRFSPTIFKKIPEIWNKDFHSYPSIVSSYEGRLIWSGVYGKPQTIWFSAANDHSDMDISKTEANSAMEITLDIKNGASILWLIEEKELIIGTQDGIYTLSSYDERGLRLESLKLRKRSSCGSADIKPVLVEDALIYVARDKMRLRRISYSTTQERLISEDLTIFSEHITKSGIKSMSVTTSPDTIIWLCMEDGSLVGLTYSYDQRVIGWHKHKIAGNHIEVNRDQEVILHKYGKVEDICSVFSQKGDNLFLLVNRGFISHKGKIDKDKEINLGVSYRTAEFLDLKSLLGESSSNLQSYQFIDCCEKIDIGSRPKNIKAKMEVNMAYANQEIYFIEQDRDGETHNKLTAKVHKYGDLSGNVIKSGVSETLDDYGAFVDRTMKARKESIYTGLPFISSMTTMPLGEDLFLKFGKESKRYTDLRISMDNTSFMEVLVDGSNPQVLVKENSKFSGIKNLKIDTGWSKKGKLTFKTDRAYYASIFTIFTNAINQRKEY